MTASWSIGGIVLAGGKSRRMGTPKAWLRVEGVTLLERAVATLQSVTPRVVVAAAVGQELPLVEQVVRDAMPDCGPLAGLHAGLCALADCDGVIALAVDLPFMTTAVLQSIVAGLQRQHHCEAAVPFVNGQWQPLAAAYRPVIRSQIEDHLHAGKLSLRELLTAMPVAAVEGLPAAAFVNWNTPADLSAPAGSMSPHESQGLFQ